MARPPRRSIGRRGFLKDAAAGAAALVAAPALAGGAQTPPQAQLRPTAPPPSAGLVAAETTPPPPRVDVYTTDRPGSDFMADVLKSLGFEYVAANPGSSFRGLHESFINYGGNKSPELLTCCHEESSVAMAHGYAKIEGKPMLVMAHGTVGLQHASMAIYNAYADRVPVYIVLGNIADAGWRRSDVEWTHSVQDAAAMVRDYTKWDDMPASLGPLRRVGRPRLQDRDDAAVRSGGHRRRRRAAGRRDRRSGPRTNCACRSSRRRRRPPADAGAIAELAKMLVAAENPAIVAGRVARTPAGLTRLTELAELLQAPVHDGQFMLRMNFPTRHPLERTRQPRRRRFHPRAREAGFLPGNPRADTGQPLRDGGAPRHQGGREDRHHLVAGSVDAEQLPGRWPLQRGRPRDCRGRRSDAAGAGRGLQATHHRRPQARDRTARRAGWPKPAGGRATRCSTRPRGDGTPARFRPRGCRPSCGIRSSAKTGRSSPTSTFISNWPLRMWDFTKHYQFIGWSGAYGIGYGAPAAVGAALANRKHGRLSVNIQCDGDLNYAPARAVDRGASQDSAAQRHAQQPRLPSGADVRHRHGGAREPRRQPRATSATSSTIRRSTTRRWPRPTASTARADRQPERSRAGDQEGDRGREARRAGAVDVVTQPR